jgi:2-oxo-4-hydroxy-4-carboxy-5-ureidoimidazoline decarboxylase
MATIEELNTMDRRGFVDAVGWVFEHSPWVAERAWIHRPFASLESLHQAMECEMMTGHREEQLALLRAHPDLGTRAKVSASSASEQAGAGLDRLTREQFDRLQRLNEAYKARFGFPFLYAVKGSAAAAIIDALERRIAAEPASEWAEALRQVSRIARLRLEQIVGAAGS